MCLINKATAVVGGAIEACGCKQIDAVIAPVKTTREVGEGHNFEYGHAEICESRQFINGCLPGAGVGKGPQVHLINDLPLQSHTTPALVMPLEGSRIYNLRRAMGAMRLKA
jgi:hypothetical protein